MQTRRFFILIQGEQERRFYTGCEKYSGMEEIMEKQDILKNYFFLKFIYFIILCV